MQLALPGNVGCGQIQEVEHMIYMFSFFLNVSCVFHVRCHICFSFYLVIAFVFFGFSTIECFVPWWLMIAFDLHVL